MCFGNRLQWILPLAAMVIVATSSMMLFQEDPPVGNPPPAPMWSIVEPKTHRTFEHTVDIFASGTKIDNEFGKVMLDYLTPETVAGQKMIAAPGTTRMKEFNPPQAGWSMPNSDYDYVNMRWKKTYFVDLWKDNGAGGFDLVGMPLVIWIVKPGDPPQ